MDLLLDKDGDLVIGIDLQFTSGIDTIAQGIRVRLETFFGEWFLDETEGLRYFEVILGQKFDRQRVNTEVTRVIVRTPGVDEVASITSLFNAETRELNVSWVVVTQFGVIEDSLLLEL